MQWTGHPPGEEEHDGVSGPLGQSQAKLSLQGHKQRKKEAHQRVQDDWALIRTQDEMQRARDGFKTKSVGNGSRDSDGEEARWNGSRDSDGEEERWNGR